MMNPTVVQYLVHHSASSLQVERWKHLTFCTHSLCQYRDSSPSPVRLKCQLTVYIQAGVSNVRSPDLDEGIVN